MSWLGDVLFGKREKQPVLIHLSTKVVAGLETMVYLHNSRSPQINHIIVDDIMEYAATQMVKRNLKFSGKEESGKKLVPEYDVEDYGHTRIGVSDVKLNNYKLKPVRAYPSSS